LRYLGLDVGDARIGVAVSDETATLATAIDTIQCIGPKKDARAIAGLVAEHRVGEVVFGLPRNMDGSVGPQAQKVLDFAERIKRHVAVPVVAWDERLTTVMANRAMVEAGASREQRRHNVDRVAAVLILQNYLDYKKMANPAGPELSS